jgi:hypothetical protein
METKNNNYDLKNYEDVLRFVKERYNRYTDEEQEVIAMTIYTLYNEVRNTGYDYEDIEEYDGLNFEIERIEPFEHYVVTIDKDEEYRLFLNEGAMERYAKEIASEYAEERISEVDKAFPYMAEYIDEDRLIEDIMLDTPSLIGLYDGNEYSVNINGEDVYLYRLN